MIAGLIDTDEGDIFLNKARINHLPMHMRSKEGIGYLPQESSIFRGLTVEENNLSVLEVQKYEKLLMQSLTVEQLPHAMQKILKV